MLEFQFIEKESNKLLNMVSTENLPRVLYHYTNNNGLLGILSSKEFWSTNCRFMNDYSEMDHGFIIAKQVIEDEISNNSNNIIKEFLKKFLQMFLRPAWYAFDVYVTSFSENGDLLSQWRGYGESGNGYSIGFNGKSLNNLNENVILSKVIYNLDMQQTMLKEIITNVSNLYLSKLDDINENNRERFSDECMILLAELLIGKVYSLKNPTFSEEKEWRLIHLSSKIIVKDKDEIIENPYSEVGFREGSGYLIPYKQVKLTDKKLIDIEEIILGPSINFELKRMSIDLLLKKLGYTVNVNNSEIPYRL